MLTKPAIRCDSSDLPPYLILDFAAVRVYFLIVFVDFGYRFSKERKINGEISEKGSPTHPRLRTVRCVRWKRQGKGRAVSFWIGNNLQMVGQTGRLYRLGGTIDLVKESAENTKKGHIMAQSIKDETKW